MDSGGAQRGEGNVNWQTWSRDRKQFGQWLGRKLQAGPGLGADTRAGRRD